jgi:non-specific serine/threonine protein kinase
MVHKFLTKGTIEEKIDAMLEQKSRLADEVIGQGGGENWLTEMDNEALRKMVTLSL